MGAVAKRPHQRVQRLRLHRIGIGAIPQPIGAPRLTVQVDGGLGAALGAGAGPIEAREFVVPVRRGVGLRLRAAGSSR